MGEHAHLAAGGAHVVAICGGQALAFGANDAGQCDVPALPPGCAFAPRCQWVEAGTCTSAVPMLRTLGTGRSAACARVEAIARN